MIRFLIRRALQAIPLLFIISALVFALIHAAPGGPLAMYLSNPNVRPEDIERLRRALGLDRPLWEQYWSWLVAFVRGDWGYSFSDGRAVAARVAERLPATLELVAVSIAGALIGGPVAGVATILAQKILKDPLDQIFAYEYNVTGTWTEPQVSKIERPSPTATEAN